MAKYKAKTKDNKCIFCEIVSGNIKSTKFFWENKNFVAFLSVDPNTKGFSCIIPKKHYGSDVFKMPNNILREFIFSAKKVAFILENYFEDVGRVGMITEGTGINHAHIKLVPMHGTENLKNGIWKQVLCKKEFYFKKYEGWISSAGGPLASKKKLKKLTEELIKFQK